MKKLILSLILSLSIGFVMAQKDYNAAITEPVVELVNGSYLIEDYVILKGPRSSKQLELKAEMPSDCIVHRDKFIAYTTEILTKIIAGMDQQLKVKKIDRLTGEADFNIHVIYTDQGVQFSLTSNGKTNRETMSWKQFFDEL